MVKKICITIFSIAVMITGTFAFHKLNYWEKSVSIFNNKTFDRHYEGRGRRGDRGTAEFERRGGSREDRNTGEFEGRRGRGQNGEFRDRYEGRDRYDGRDRGGHGRGDFRRGKKVRLGSVLWFLAVFASFTAVTIYVDKAHIKFLKRKSSGRWGQYTR